MRDEYETNRYNEHDLWRFAIGDLVQIREERGWRTGARLSLEGTALVVDRHVEGAYVEGRPIKYQTQEKYRLVYAGESRWLSAELLKKTSEEHQHTA